MKRAASSLLVVLLSASLAFGDQYFGGVGQPGPAGAAGPEGPQGPAGADGSDGTPGVPGVDANRPLSVCGTAYTGSGLVYRVSACDYVINGTTYSAPETEITLDAADATHPRIDLIVATTSNTIEKVTGTAAASPNSPEVDPTTQLQLANVDLPALATTPANVTVEDVYLEDAEWTCAESDASHDCASTSNPRTGTKDVEGTSVGNNDIVSFTAGSPLALTAYNNLVLYLRLKADWGSQQYELRFYNAGGSAVGSAVTLKCGFFSLSCANTSSYQLVVIPLSSFATGGTNISKLQWKKKGAGTLGFYLDDMVLQGGVEMTVTGSASEVWKGAWNETATYAVNDEVSYGGISYIAITSSTNVTPGTDATKWTAKVTKTGLDTEIVSGTPGATDDCAKWNADGDLVTAGAACGSGGGGAFTVVSITSADSPYSLSADGNILLLADTSSGSITVNLPDANGNTGKFYHIKKTSGSNTLTLDGDSADTIDGAATFDWTIANQAYSIAAVSASAWVLY